MNKKRALFIRILIILLVLILSVLVILPGYIDKKVNGISGPGEIKISDRANTIFNKAIIIDLHSDLLLWNRPLLEKSSYGHTDIPRLTEGNVAVQVFSSVTRVPFGLNYDTNTIDNGDLITFLAVMQFQPFSTWFNPMNRTLYHAEKLKKAERDSHGIFRILYSGKDFVEYINSRMTGKINGTAGILSIEGLHALNGDLKNIEVIQKAGFRIIGLSHFFDNEIAGSAHGLHKRGLTPFGVKVVTELEKRNMIIDLAHISKESFDEVIENTSKPLLVSHTGIYKTCPGNRNLTDSQIQKLIQRKSLIGIGYFKGALCDLDPIAFVRAVKHVLSLGGEDNLALGSDFDGAVAMPFDTTGLDILVELMLREKIEERVIFKILGENAVKFLATNL